MKRLIGFVVAVALLISAGSFLAQSAALAGDRDIGPMSSSNTSF